MPRPRLAQLAAATACLLVLATAAQPLAVHAAEAAPVLRSDAIEAPFTTPALAEALAAVRRHAVARATGLTPEPTALEEARAALRTGLHTAHEGELAPALLLALRIFDARNDATAAAAVAAIAAMIEPALASELWLEVAAQRLRAGLGARPELLPDAVPRALQDRAALVRAIAHAQQSSDSDRALAAHTLTTALDRDAADEDERRALCLLAASLLDQAPDGAAPAYADLARATEPGCAGLDAATTAAALRKARAREPAWAQPLEPAQRLQAARRLYVLVQHDAVIEILAPLADDASAAPEARCEALWRTAMTYRRSKRAPQSRAPYRTMRDACAALPEWHRRALYGIAWNDFAENKLEDGKKNFELLLEMHPDGGYGDDALFYLARIAAARGDAAGAAATLAPLLDGTVALDDLGGDALWRALEAVDPAQREPLLDAALERSWQDASYFSQGRLAYVAAVERGDVALLVRVAEHAPLSFYAWLARSELAARADGDAQAQAALADWDDALTLAREPARPLTFAGALPPPEHGTGAEAAARAWFAAGASARAARLLAADDAPLQGARGWLVAYGLHLEGEYRRSHALAGTLLGGIAPMPDPSNRLLWEMAFPQPYRDEVLAAAAESGIAPELAWAIMREESAFQPEVESYAHAIGLMQLLESTAKSHGKRALGLEVDAAALREPATNIRVGSAFLAHLAARLGAHPVLVASAYNAGRGAVGGWLEARGEWPLHAFVEAIPYQQTRDYSKRVSRSLLIYRVLYGQGPVEPLRLTDIASAGAKNEGSSR